MLACMIKPLEGTSFFSTHVLEVVGRICSRIVIIDKRQSRCRLEHLLRQRAIVIARDLEFVS